VGAMPADIRCWQAGALRTPKDRPVTTMLKRYARDEGGAVTVLVALLLPVLLGFVALVAEYGFGFAVKAENQRIADIAAYAGATAYKTASSTSDMNAAVSRIATLNGISSSAAAASVITSPRTAGSSAVSVTVSTGRSLFLSRVISDTSALQIQADAAAEIPTVSVPGCVLALSASETGVTLSGGTSINAPSCAVSSNNTVSVPCGTTITARGVNYNSASAPSQPCNGIQAPSGQTVTISKTATADPFASDPNVTSATSHLATVGSQSAGTISSVATGTNIEFGWNQSQTTTAAATIGCAAAWNNGTSTWTLTCPSRANSYKFGTVTKGGGITLNFAVGGAATNKYDFSGTITLPGTNSFGPGTYNFSKGIKTEGGSTTTFDAGTFKVGQMTASCSGATYSICHTGTTLTFGGPSSFTITNGIYNGGGGTLNIGSGTTNSYDIGASSGGNALFLNGGSKTTFADATAASPDPGFKATGNINVTSGGGSCLTLPAATNHDIKGFFAGAGGTKFGAGIYTIRDYLGFGINGGGNVDCNSSNIGVLADNVTIVLGGTNLPSSGTCSGQAFCLGAGYSSVQITAPSSTKLAVIGPTSSGAAGATMTQGSTGSKISGAFYFPLGPVLMSGGASVADGTGTCLQIVGSRVTLTGGSTAASACVSSGSTGSGSVVLVD
jgi:Flp pilus assembly protein TadG